MDLPPLEWPVVLMVRLYVHVRGADGVVGHVPQQMDAVPVIVRVGLCDPDEEPDSGEPSDGRVGVHDVERRVWPLPLEVVVQLAAAVYGRTSGAREAELSVRLEQGAERPADELCE